MVFEGIAAAMWAAFVLLSCASAVVFGGGSSGRSSDSQPLSSPHFTGVHLKASQLSRGTYS